MSDDKKKGSTAMTVTKVLATGVAAYIAYRTFRKRQGTIEGLLEGFLSNLKKR